jgi:hypothetical protein
LDIQLLVLDDAGYIVDLLCPETDDIRTMNAGADLEARPTGSLAT